MDHYKRNNYAAVKYSKKQDFLTNRLRGDHNYIQSHDVEVPYSTVPYCLEGLQYTYG